MFYAINKLGAVALYAITIASFIVIVPLPPEIIHWIRIASGVLLVAHAVECVVFIGKIKLHPGPLLDSLVLTLLFGFLHWKPLADAKR